MTGNVIFYTNPMSRGRMVRWMLEEVGCPYDTKVVDYGPAMQSPDYLAINPMGKVPAIQHAGQTVTECAAICAYLADAFPEAGLAPPASDRAAYYRYLFFAAGPLEQAATNHSLGFEPEGLRNQGMAGYGSYKRTLDALEKMIPARGFITGDSFTAADVYFGAHIGWGLLFGSLEARPGMADYWERVSDRDAYRRAKEADDAITPADANT